MASDEGKLGFPAPNQPLVSFTGMLSLGELLKEELSEDQLQIVADELTAQVGEDMAANAGTIAAEMIVDLLGGQN